MSTNTATAPVANLRETKRAQAAAKKAHPAGKATPAKKPAATKPAAKPADEAKATRPSIRWQYVGEHGSGEQHGVTTNAIYAITGEGKEWTATANTPDGKETVLADKVSHGRAYTARVRHSATLVAVEMTA